MRRSALDTVDRWSEGLRIEDWDLFLRLAARDALGFIDVSVCAYRIHGNNLSTTRHKGTRISNLAESRQVAMQRANLFAEPYRTLLMAQSHYIAAKISFLDRRLWPLLHHMLAYLSLVMVSKARTPAASPDGEKA
jgi:hypothetical protein